MNTNENSKFSQVGGIGTNRVVVPVIILLAILHLAIIFLIISINDESSKLSRNIQSAGQYTSDATSLLAGSSLLSETTSNFVLMPTTENGGFNMMPLAAYAAELKKDRRGPQVLARFQKYDVSEEDRAYIAEAADCADQMMQAQLHALALMTSIYPIPNTDFMDQIPLPELTKEEASYPKEQKMAVARELVLGSEYALNKQTVSTDVNLCAANLQKESGMKSAATAAKVRTLRILMWITTILIILILTLTFIALYRQLLSPLKRSTRLISSDQPLDEQRGLREMRLMACAYNALLHRRDALDRILRAAAETDALTQLPNRYAFQQYLVESEDKEALGIILFDVNYLKKTNDSFGHAAGDDLLRKSADCIASCFGDADGSNCFRLGGDEFAAVLMHPDQTVIEEEIRKFQEAQSHQDISISWGCALSSELGTLDADALMAEADRRMYEQKKAMHEQL